jgi:hypothetical protein
MYAKRIAAAAAGLCLMWGTAQAENDSAQERGAAAPAEAPEAVGATNDVVILEIAPAQGPGAASAEEIAAMQMLLLQFLLMQSDGTGNAEAIDIPRAPAGVGI